MEKLTKLEINCQTGEEIITELTQTEILALEAESAVIEAQLIAEETEKTRVTALKTSARAKLISGTPLTEEEAAVLVI